MLVPGNLRSERDAWVNGRDFPCLRHLLTRLHRFNLLQKQVPGSLRKNFEFDTSNRSEMVARDRSRARAQRWWAFPGLQRWASASRGVECTLIALLSPRPFQDAQDRGICPMQTKVTSNLGTGLAIAWACLYFNRPINSPRDRLVRTGDVRLLLPWKSLVCTRG